MSGFWGCIILLAGVLLQSLLYASGMVGHDYILIAFVVGSAVFFINALSLHFPIKMRHIMTAIFVFRLAILFWNVYARHIFLLIGVGADAISFYYTAVFISQHLEMLNTSVYGEYYSKYLGIVYSLTGPSFLLGSYLNYLYGLLTIYFLSDVVNNICIHNPKAYKIAMYLFAVTPLNMILSTSLRRESIMILFAVMSVRKLYQWTLSGKQLHMILSMFFLLCSSIFHAGMIGLALGHVFLFLFYDPFTKKYNFTAKTLGVAMLISVFGLVVINEYSAVFLRKIMVTDEEALYGIMSKARGGAAYLTSLNITSWLDAFLYSPLKIVYFLLSPMPWDWRSAADIIAFMFDSLIYIYLLTELLLNYRDSKYTSRFGFLLALFGCLLLFAMGSQNAGTAMRHRCKLLPLLIILYCIVNVFNNDNTKRESGV